MELDSIENKLENAYVSIREIYELIDELHDTNSRLKDLRDQKNRDAEELSRRIQAVELELAEKFELQKKESEKRRLGKNDNTDYQLLLKSKKREAQAKRAQNVILLVEYLQIAVEKQNSITFELVAEEIDTIKGEISALTKEIVSKKGILNSAVKQIPVSPDELVLSLMNGWKIIENDLREDSDCLKKKQHLLERENTQLDAEIKRLSRTLENLAMEFD